MLEKVKHIY